MSDLDEGAREDAQGTVDGITANDQNAFTSVGYGIALVVKPRMNAGDFERWIKNFKLFEDEPIAAQRLRLFFGAVEAGIIVHCTDSVTKATMREVDAMRAQWYGSQLITVYKQYTYLDPN
jgi:hypothetical protein